MELETSPPTSLRSSVSLPVSCAATTEGEGRGLQNEEQKSLQQQRCSPPPGFGSDSFNSDTNALKTNGQIEGGEVENVCKVEADIRQKKIQKVNGNSDRKHNDAQQESGVGSTGISNQQQEPPNNNNLNDQITNGPFSSHSATENSNSILLPGIPPEIAAAINGGHDLFVSFNFLTNVFGY
jgi:hypothetical protein